MAQLITCPECKKHLQVPDELFGKTVQCPECGHMFTASAPEVPGGPPVSWPRPEIKPHEEPKPRSRYDEDDGIDDRPQRAPDIRRGSSDKPSKVQTIGIISLIGGIFAILWFLGIPAASGGVCCLWPGMYYSLVVGILAIIKGSALLGNDAYRNPPPTGIAIMLIINIVNADIVGLVLGIVMLVFCGDDEVKAYLAK